MRTFLRFARKAAFNYFWSLGIGNAPIVALLTLWDDPGSSVFVLTAIGLGLVIAGVYIVITAATGVPAGGSACSGLRTRPPGSGSSGDGNVGGPKVEIASELAGLFPQDVRFWRLAPRLRDAGHWSQGSAEAHRMAASPPLGRGEDAKSIEGNSFISPTHTGGA